MSDHTGRAMRSKTEEHPEDIAMGRAVTGRGKRARAWVQVRRRSGGDMGQANHIGNELIGMTRRQSTSIAVGRTRQETNVSYVGARINYQP